MEDGKKIKIFDRLVSKIDKENDIVLSLQYKIDLNSLIDKFHNLLYKNYKDTEIKNYYNLLCEKNKKSIWNLMQLI